MTAWVANVGLLQHGVDLVPPRRSPPSWHPRHLATVLREYVDQGIGALHQSPQPSIHSSIDTADPVLAPSVIELATPTQVRPAVWGRTSTRVVDYGFRGFDVVGRALALAPGHAERLPAVESR